jgi:outer membrane protein assembly factor BamA
MPVRPVTIAVRGLHYGRYGRDAEHDRLLNLYVGHPEFVRGYGLGSFTPIGCLRRASASGGECDLFENLTGSRMLVGNIEVRAPLPGLWRGEIEYGRIPVDVVAFADAGLSWTNADQPWFAGGPRHPVRSVGGAVRVSVFGLLAVEVAASRPLDRVDRDLQWQIGIRQGF